MRLINNKYAHKSGDFDIEVTTCNKRIATTVNSVSGEIVKFNRPKLEWMISSGIFTLISE